MKTALALLLCLCLCLSAVPAACALGSADGPPEWDGWPDPPAPPADSRYPAGDAETFASGGPYNASLAAQYALYWWNSFNPAYHNFEADGYGDCTNFVSQCLCAGGLPMTNGWYWESLGNYSGSWTIPNELARYLFYGGYNMILYPSADDISTGDVLFYDWDEDGNWDHAAICVDDSGGARTICAHSRPHCTTAWALGAPRYGLAQMNGSTGANGTKLPGKPAFTGMSTRYEAGVPVSFAWGPTENTTHYCLRLYRYIESVPTFQLLRQDNGVTSGFRLTLEQGVYKAVLRAYNSAEVMPDGSDWAYTDSDPAFFEVVEAARFTVSYDANGGTGAPAAQTKTRGTALTLSAQIPTRAGWYFLGWAESASAAEAAYRPGGSYTADRSVTLYALWGRPDLTLPAALTSVGEEAFAGGAFRFVQLPERTAEIRRAAFADCRSLRYVYIPASCVRIDAEAFAGTSGLTILCRPGSAAETFAAQKGYAVMPVP